MDRRRGRLAIRSAWPAATISASIVGRDRRGSATRSAGWRLAHTPLRAQGLVDGTCAREPQRDAREGPQVG